jgi:hypothetical protein
LSKPSLFVIPDDRRAIRSACGGTGPGASNDPVVACASKGDKPLSYNGGDDQEKAKNNH